MIKTIPYLILGAILVYTNYHLRKKSDNKEIRVDKNINYKYLFNHFPKPLLLLNSKNKIISFNEQFLLEFGFKEEEIKNKEVYNIIDFDNSLLKALNKGSYQNSYGEYKGKGKIRDNGESQPQIKVKMFPAFKDDKLIGKYVLLEEFQYGMENMSTMLRQSRRKIRDLHQTALKMKKVSSEQEVFNLTIKAAENILDFDLCTLDMVEGDQLVVKATSSNITNNESISAPIDSKNLATYVFKNKQSHLAKDIQKLDFANPTNQKYHSALTISIGELGVFQAVSTKIDDFTREDLELVELLIAHTLSAYQRIKMNKKIRYIGFHDNLTGLYNRHFLNEEIDRLGDSRKLPISVIVGDLNGLKLINDIFGHEEGDKYLKKTANLLKDSMRQEDILGRWGGDEFIVLLPETSAEEAEEIKKRISTKLKSTYNDERPISISLGLATKSKNNEKGIKKIIEKADYKMYKNKASMHQQKNNPLIDMIKTKIKEEKLNLGEMYRMDNLIEMFKSEC
ncbi:MAG: diguanylate cyclase [Halanaerobiales bacterium]|nr:diguanylate cyclase [Halanaerobiales bacterium]